MFCLNCNAAMDNSAAEDTGGTRLKRRRKPSEKVLELQQAEKSRKPLQKPKTYGKPVRSKSKSTLGEDYDYSVDEGDVNGYH